MTKLTEYSVLGSTGRYLGTARPELKGVSFSGSSSRPAYAGRLRAEEHSGARSWTLSRDRLGGKQLEKQQKTDASG